MNKQDIFNKYSCVATVRLKDGEIAGLLMCVISDTVYVMFEGFIYKYSL